MISRPLRSRRLGVRIAWLVGVLGASVLVLWLNDKLSNLPPGYGNKQYKSASELLKLRDEWTALRRGTTRDLAIYIPIYIGWGLAVAGMVGAAGLTKGGSARRGWARLVRSPRAIAGAYLVAGLTDVIETLLFRTSLSRLIDTDGAARIDTLTRTTLVFTVLKFLALVAGFVLVVFQVVKGPESRRG